MLCALIAGALLQETRVDSLTGDIRHHPAFASTLLGNSRDVWVYLPPQYKTHPKDSFPVLYLHDGQNVFSGKTSYIPNKEWKADEAAEALIKTEKIRPIIIVAVSNAGASRGDEYVPTRFKTNGGQELGGKGDLYGKFLIDELIPFINKSYRTKTGRDNTGLAGSSLGGVITSYLGAKHPNSFGLLGVLSPSVWINGKEPLQWVRDKKEKPKQRVWIDIGGSEGNGAVEDARALKAAYQSRGFKLGKDLVYYEEGFAGHNEDAWARRFPALLLFFFGK